MFKHVLVAVDGSQYSVRALPAAIELAGKFGADLFVLHVAEHDRGRAAAFTLETPAEATRLVADAVAQARAAGVTARGELVDKGAGHVAQAIQECAAAHNVDLIVMGSRGLSDAQGFFLGSVTHKVMQQVEVPVLVTRGAKPTKTEAPVPASFAGAV